VTALNAATYADMAARGRPASRTPNRSVEKLADLLHVSIPDDGDRRSNRVAGLAGLTGLLTGVTVGAGLGLARAAGRPRGSAGGLIAAAGAMVGANGPMVAMGITNPRGWTAAGWAADVLPHLAYGVVTVWVLDQLDH
jgi:hypothetical protein